MGSFNQLLKENASCRDIFECFFDLMPTEVSIFYLLSHEKNLDEISEEMHKDRTTAYRCLQKLVGAGLVVKEKRIIREGGYYYSYSRVDASTIRKIVNSRMREVSHALNAIIKRLESELDQSSHAN
ncbi:MAG: helix-turn-helix domain-containing protein [Thermoplasmataceae archaeon]|jgi:predicted transcriptional regulator